MKDGMVLNVPVHECVKIVPHWLKHPTGITVDVGSIPSWNSEVFSAVPSPIAKHPAFKTLIFLVAKWKKLVTFATVFGVQYCWPGSR